MTTTGRLNTNYTITVLSPGTSNATLVITYAGDAYPREAFNAELVHYEYDMADPRGPFTMDDQSHKTTLLSIRCTSPAHTDVADLVAQLVTIGSAAAFNVNVVNLLNPHPITGTVTANQGTTPWVVGDGGGSLTVDGTVAVSNLTDPLNVNVTNASLAVNDGGGSLTVDGTVAVSNFPAVQPVSGTVAVTQNTTPWVVGDGGGSLTVDGTVNVGNFPAVQPVSDNGGSLTVDGTVAVSNFPATQPVSGTVAVSNFPAVYPVNDNGGSLTVDGTVAVTQNTSPWVVGDGGGSISVDDNGGSLTVDGTVNVGNFPATQAVTQSTTPWVVGDGGGSISVDDNGGSLTVDGTVTVNQGTNPWTISGTVGPAIPASADIVGTSRNTTGTLYTVPAGRTFFGSLSLSCSISVAGANNPTMSVANSGGGSGIAPAAGTIMQINNTGLALVSVANSNTLSDSYIYGGTNGCVITFTAGATGNSSGQIAGRLL